MARTKRQHYVTRAYLEGFLCKGESLLYCYGRQREIPFRALPQNLANQRNFYSFRNVTGDWDDSAEKLLGDLIEMPGLNVLRKLLDGRYRLTRKERSQLALLVAVQELRTPYAREQIVKTLDGFARSIIDGYEQIPPNRRPDIVSLDLRESHTEVKIADVYAAFNDSQEQKDKKALFQSFGAALDASKLYEHMKWTVLISPRDAAFVTTDSPVIRVYYRGPGGAAGLNRADVEIRFPLSRGAMLAITHDGQAAKRLVNANERERARLLGLQKEIRQTPLSKAEVMLLNRDHAAHACKWLFSGEAQSWSKPLLGPTSLNIQSVYINDGEKAGTRNVVLYDPTQYLR